MTQQSAPEWADARTCLGCGHVFQTRRQRVNHEQKAERGERVLCPCGEVCSEGPHSTAPERTDNDDR